MIVRVRMFFVILGVAAFAFAMRTELEWARWAGIACMATALLLRFVGRGGNRDADETAQEADPKNAD